MKNCSVLFLGCSHCNSSNNRIYITSPKLRFNIFAKISPFNYLGTLSSNIILTAKFKPDGIKSVKYFSSKTNESVILDVSASPSYVTEVSASINRIVLDCTASEIITRLRNISELDEFVLSEADNYSLEELDFISLES